MSKGRKGRKGNPNCHFDPFGKAQDKLREKSFLGPSYVIYGCECPHQSGNIQVGNIHLDQ
jgi:hypothetical protein